MLRITSFYKWKHYMLVSEKYKSPNFYVSLLVNYGILRKTSYLCRKFRHSLYIARLWKKKNITLYRCARMKNCQWALSQGTWFVEGRLLAWFYVCSGVVFIPQSSCASIISRSSRSASSCIWSGQFGWGSWRTWLQRYCTRTNTHRWIYRQAFCVLQRPR